jgi:hypothetical protein
MLAVLFWLNKVLICKKCTLKALDKDAGPGWLHILQRHEKLKLFYIAPAMFFNLKI